VISHSAVQANVGKVAVERGPLVYCAEGIDNGGHVLDAVLADDVALHAELAPDLWDGVVVIRAAELTLVPYYAWSHRGVGEMAVWFERVGESLASSPSAQSTQS